MIELILIVGLAGVFYINRNPDCAFVAKFPVARCVIPNNTSALAYNFKR